MKRAPGQSLGWGFVVLGVSWLVSLIALPPSLWALVRYRQRLETSVRDLRERSADIGSFLIETLLGMRLVVGANAQEREAARFRERNDAFVSSLMSMRLLTYLAGGLPALLLALGTAAVFLYGGARVIEGTTTLGTRSTSERCASSHRSPIS